MTEQQAQVEPATAAPKKARSWTRTLMWVLGPALVLGAGLREEVLHGVKPGDFDALLRVLAQIKDNLVALDGAPIEERGKS